jgi:hypothetical protein
MERGNLAILEGSDRYEVSVNNVKLEKGEKVLLIADDKKEDDVNDGEQWSFLVLGELSLIGPEIFSLAPSTSRTLRLLQNKEVVLPISHVFMKTEEWLCKNVNPKSSSAINQSNFVETMSRIRDRSDAIQILLEQQPETEAQAARANLMDQVRTASRGASQRSGGASKDALSPDNGDEVSYKSKSKIKRGSKRSRADSDSGSDDNESEDEILSHLRIAKVSKGISLEGGDKVPPMGLTVK